jgi:hypothetical protein
MQAPEAPEAAQAAEAAVADPEASRIRAARRRNDAASKSLLGLTQETGSQVSLTKSLLGD